MDRKEYIIYTRVSTEEQKKSGLGLESQESICRKYVESVDGIIIGIYTDADSGDSTSRTEMTKAIEDAKMFGATLVFDRIDRFTRDVEFGYKIKNSGVDLVFCDNPHMTSFEFGLRLLLAQEDLNRIRGNTRKALDVIKNNLKKDGYHVSKSGRDITRLGNTRSLDEPGNYMEAGIKGGERAAEVHRAKKEASRDWQMSYREACKLRDEGLPYRTIAERLNEGEYKNSKGSSWSWQGVYKMLN